MKKFAIALIVIALLVVVGANWFLSRLDSEAPAPPPEVDNTTIRTTTSGDVVGFIDTYGARAWMGIPFAAPPEGTGRWRAPRPPEPWTTTRETLAAGPMCPQFASLLSGAGVEGGGSAITGTEDCLYLNVWSRPNAQKLPVMVWVHGGGNSIGHGGSYIGARLAAEQGVVVITINYRLGVFGWFSHPALDNGNPADASGNYGTLDLVRALEWTRDNVAAFGGDPDNVTLFGESAGGFDTLAMIASPLAKGLFHRAIVQSGGFGVTELAHGHNYAAAGGHKNSSKEIIAAMMVADGSAVDIDSARAQQDDMSSAQVREYLFSKPMEDFFAPLDGGGFGMVNVPDNFGDGHVLPNLSNAEIFGDPSQHNMVPTVLGTNRDEPALFMARSPRYVSNFLGFLPRFRDEDAYLRDVKYGALAWKERGVDSIATLMQQAGNPDVYTYRFDWDEEPTIMGYDLSKALGAAHGLEIAFVFGEFERGMGLGYVYGDNENNDPLAKNMMSYWAEFARNGNPGTGNGAGPGWLPFGTNNKTHMIFDTPNPGIRMGEELVTLASLKAQMATDPDIATQEDRCRLYAQNFRDDNFNATEYAGFGTEGCGAFPVASMREF